MCGIVGLYMKDERQGDRIGEMFAPMLECMTDRGPDSAGFAIYGPDAPEGAIKVTLRRMDDGVDWSAIADDLGCTFESDTSVAVNATYAVIKIVTRQQRDCDVRVLVNMVKDSDEARSVFKRIDAVCRRFLNLSTLYTGHVVTDPRVSIAVRRRRPFILDSPNCDASGCINQLAHRMES